MCDTFLITYMHYAITFISLGLILCWWAVSIGGIGYLLLWPAMSSFILFIGYVGAGCQIFGKSTAGTITWAWFIHLPFFVYSLLVWHLVRLLSRENPVDKITEDFYIGRRLLDRETPSGIHNWVDLTAEFVDTPSQRTQHHYLNLPILDGMVPNVDSLYAAVNALEPGTTFVHCAQGHGRTGLFALAWLAQHGLIDNVEQGIVMLNKKRPGIALNSVQLRFMRQYLHDIKNRL